MGRKKKQLFRLKCWKCGQPLSLNSVVISEHFLKQHQIALTPGQVHRMATKGTRKQNKKIPYSDRDFAKPKCEVSGGGFSKK